jgi:hypothetical protein
MALFFFGHMHDPIFGVISFEATWQTGPHAEKYFGVMNCEATRAIRGYAVCD